MSNINYRALAEQLLLPHKEGEINKTVAVYQKILNNGLSGKTKSAKEIIVVGAGIAGLLAAELLADFGHKVVVLEANGNRVGGRIKTFRNESGGKQFFEDDAQYAEAGAMRFPTHHPLLMDLFDKLKLETQEFYATDVAPTASISHYKTGNTLMRCNSFQNIRYEYNNAPEAMNARFSENFSQSKSNQSTAGEMLDKALDTARNYYSHKVKQLDGSVKRENFANYDDWINGWARLIERYDQYTFRQYLLEEGLDANTLDIIGTIENLTSRMPLSFIHSFLGRSVINPNIKYKEIKGGSWKITDTYYQKLQQHPNIEFRLNHRMTHLDYKKNEEEMGKHLKGKEVSVYSICENGQKNDPVRGDLAIVTIPFSSLRFVHVTPQFSYKKRRAIIELHYDSATKVLLEFKKRWWEFDKEQWKQELTLLKSQGHITEEEYNDYTKEVDNDKRKTGARGGGSVTDNPNRFIYYPSHPVGANSSSGVVLASYTWADDARRWDSMNDDDRYQYALHGLTLLHGARITPFFTGKGATQSWGRSPYAFGEAAVFAAGQFTQLHPYIPTSEGPIYFAGEHVSLKHAWVEGALETAIAVAQEVANVTDPNTNKTSAYEQALNLK